jgi:hypothetical protein
MKQTLSGLIAVLLPLVFVHPLVIAQESFPRTPSGKPDFSGNYTVSTLTPIERPSEFGDRLIATPEEVQALRDRNNAARERRFAPTLEHTVPEVGGDIGGYNEFWRTRANDGFVIDGQYRTSTLTYPENGQMPALTPAGQAKAGEVPETDGAWWLETGEQPYDGPETLTLIDRCIFHPKSTIPILQRVYNNLKTIVQTDDYLMIYIEWMHWARIIRINGEHKPAELATYDGDSIGWWEGDTLVVETVNFLEDFRRLADRRVIERFRPNDDGGLVYSFTVEDADYTDSYSGEMPWPRTDQVPYEFACHEGNYALPGILAGARLQEVEHRARKGSEN